jgi:hypothetical protein
MRVADASEQTQARAAEACWLIYFDDADRKCEVFTGKGAEDAARTRSIDVAGAWNHTLFVEVDALDALLADLAAAERRASEMEAHANALANRDETVQQAYEALRAAERERDEARRTADGMARAPYGEFEAMRVRAEEAEARAERAERERDDAMLAARSQQALANDERARAERLQEARDELLDALAACVQTGTDEDDKKWVAINPGGLDAALAMLRKHGRL